MKNFLITGFLISALFTPPGHLATAAPSSSDGLPLKALIQTALENSPILQRSEAELKEGEWKNAEGISGLLPVITITGNHFFEKKYQLLDVSIGGGPLVQIPQIFPSTSASVSARWTLFDGLSNINHMRSGQNQKKAAEARYHWEKFTLEREVTLAYYKWIAATRLLEVAKENLKTLETHLSQVKNLKSGGVATSYDILKVDTQFSEAQSELLQASDNVELAREKLMVVIGLETASIPGESTLPIPEPEKISGVTFKSNSESRLDLRALESQTEAIQRIDQSTRYFWLPRFSLGADYTEYNNLTDPVTDWNRFRSAWSVGIFFNWTIFNVRDFSLMKQNQYKAIAAEKTLRKTQLEAPTEFSFWKKRYLYSASLYLAKNADLKRAEETVRLADAGFKAGVRTTTEVLDAELELFRARAGIVTTQLNCLEAKIKLELSTGEPL